MTGKAKGSHACSPLTYRAGEDALETALDAKMTEHLGYLRHNLDLERSRPTMGAPLGSGRECVGFAGYRCGPTVRSQPVADRCYGREWAAPCRTQ
jgi:hypothetical protein